MFPNGASIRWIKRAAKFSILAGVFLLSVENVCADANFTVTATHSSVDSSRANNNMDRTGTWDGDVGLGTEVTDDETNSDRFTLTVTNSGTIASDVDIGIALPVGFRLPDTGGTQVTVTSPTNCDLIAGAIDVGTLNANQSGTTVDFNIPNSRDSIPTGCTYVFVFGLTTNDGNQPGGFPNVSSPDATITYDIEYDDNTGSNLTLTPQPTQTITVNSSQLSIVKVPITSLATNGNPVQFEVYLHNAGTGGAFDVELLDNLNPTNFSGITMTFQAYDGFTGTPGTGSFVAGPGIALPNRTQLAANRHVFDYMPPDMLIVATVDTTAVINPVSTSCPTLRNDAVATQRDTDDSASNFTEVDYLLPGTLQITHDLGQSFCVLCGTGEVYLTIENTGGLTLENVTVTENFLNSGLEYVPNSTQVSIDGGAAVALPGVNPSAGATATEIVWDLNDIYAALALPSAPAQIDSPFDPTPTNPITVQIIYQVRKDTSTGNEESLVNNDRRIQATTDYQVACDSSDQTTFGTLDELPIQQPIPNIIKTGRNVDAGQLAGDYAAIVYGHKDDDIIWQVEIQNNGAVGLEDLIIDDEIFNGSNFDINWICNSEAAATVAAGVTGGAAPPDPGCVSARSPTPPPYVDPGTGANTDDVLDYAVDDNQPGSPIDVPASGSTSVFYVGRMLSNCQDQINLTDIAWGCNANPDDGGIGDGTVGPVDSNIIRSQPAATGGIVPAFTAETSADMSAFVDGAAILDTAGANGFNITVGLSGSNLTQPPGTKGVVTITMTNNTGGTVRLWNESPVVSNPADGVNTDAAVDDNLDIRSGLTVSFQNILPAEYVMDLTYTPTAVMTPAFGNAYPGMVNQIIHTNPIADPLANTAPRFRLYSDTQYVKPNHPLPYRHLIRNGDTLTIQFGIILIDQTRYDLVADLDVAPEVDADGTDPDNTFNINNQFVLNPPNDDASPVRNQLSYCTSNPTVTLNQTVAANPEDLDVDTSSAIYILTNDPGTPLDLTVSLTNNGGHDADDYSLYVTFGEAMTVQTVPGGCAITTNPPPHPLWEDPSFIPATASVYVCDRGVIEPAPAAGSTENFTFQVIRNLAAANDDLTFRADVVGEITQSDTTLLTFPTPASVADTNPDQQLANNYTLDAVRARVLGFNLTKVQSATCTEDPGAAIPGADPAQVLDSQIRIGEDCDYYIRAGGWFGFDTPGFTLISVQDMLVTDVLPDGQGFISTDDGATSDHDTNSICTQADGVDGLCNITRSPATLPALTEGSVEWRFNQGADEALTERDKFFNLNFSSRLLNDPVDGLYPVPSPASSYTPNLHARNSTNIARASFNANYVSGAITDTFCISDTANQPVAGCIVPPGYPVAAVRQIDLTVTEPNLIVTKAVCNETLYGAGTGCSNFVTLPTIANDGDTQDTYIYRVTIANEAASGGTNRAPAFNVAVTDLLDASDLMEIAPGGATPFNSDGLDNDGDGDIDGADADGEFLSLNDNTPDGAGGTPVATFVISHQHSDALDRIDPGTSVTYYYRIDPDDTVAPLQTLTNTVSTTYDSLAGDSGNQQAPQLTNAENTSPNNTGRARIYDAIDDDASIQILPLQTQPKQIIRTSTNPTATGLASPQNVVVGEEIEYQLHAQIPVANLRDFVIRDELPPGLRCVELQSINLSNPPYSDAGFVPGGPPVSTTCTSTGTNDVVEWNFGDQELTAATSNNLFDFFATFIARVENTAVTQTPNCYIRNGGSTGAGAVTPVQCTASASLARLTYTNEASNTVTLNYAAADVVVREPIINVTKTFQAVAADRPDGTDRLTVTIQVENDAAALVSAYNIQVLDDLTGTNMAYVDNSEGGTVTPDNVDTATHVSNQPIFNWDNPASAGYELSPGETISFTFEVDVDTDVQPLELLDNTVEARWTSLDLITTALNGGTLDPNGEVMGMRDGQLTGVPADSVDAAANAANNDYNDNDTDDVTVPPFQYAKSVIYPDPDARVTSDVPAIGEHQKFQIVIDIPEGISGEVSAETTRHVRVTDNLDALAGAGETYVFESNVNYPVTYTFTDITHINDVDITAMIADVAKDEFNSIPVDGATGAIEWNIGKIQTVTENDPTNSAVNPQIVITYYARINNDANTNVGDQLQNGSALNYPNGEDMLTIASPTVLTPVVINSATAAITVQEPNLALTKTCINVTRANADCAQPAGAPDAGDVLEYLVTVTNTGDAAAFDINIRDTISAYTQLLPIPPAAAHPIGGDHTPTATINTVAVGGFNSTPINNPAGPLIWGRANGDESLDLPAPVAPATSTVLELTYRVIVLNTAEANQDIDNSVVVDWTSLNGANTLERTGAGNANCPDAVGAAQPYNDHCLGPVTISATVPNVLAVNKAVTSDDYNPVGSTVDDGELRIGDTVTYTLTLTLQEGLIRDIDVIDTLDNGLEFVSVDTINGDTSPFNSADGFLYGTDPIAAPTVTTGAGTNTITWDIGDVVNTPGDGDDTFEIVYTVRVVDNELEPEPPGPNALPTNATEVLSNNVDLDYDDANGDTGNTADDIHVGATESVTLQQPIIATVTKVRRNATPSGTPLTVADTTMDFQLEACNTGAAPAYDVILDDTLDTPWLLPATVEGPVNVLTHGVGVPDVYVNGAILANVDTDPTAATDVGADYEYEFTTGAPTSLMRITLTNVAIDPGQCAQVNFDVDVDPAVFVAGNQSWDNSFQVTEYHSLPATDPAANVAERETWGPVGPVVFNMNNLSGVGFVLNKTLIDPVAPYEVTIGDTVTYRIHIPSVGFDRYDVTITDDMSDSLMLVDATDISINAALSDCDTAATPCAITPLSVTGVGTDQISFEIDFIEDSTEIYLDVVVRVANNTTAQNTLPAFGNSASFTFASSDGGSAIIGATGATSNSVTIVEPQAAIASKTCINTSRANADCTTPAGFPDAGDILRYTIRVTASAGAVLTDVYDISILDTLSAGLSYSGNPTLIYPAPSIYSGTNFIGAPDGAATQNLTWSLSAVDSTNIDLDEGESVDIQYEVVVDDAVLANQTLNNDASIQWTSIDGASIYERDGTNTISAQGGTNDYFTAAVNSATTVTDTSSITKTRTTDTYIPGDDNVRVGDVITYQLDITLQEGTFNDLILTDVLPQGVEFVDIVSINGDTTAPYTDSNAQFTFDSAGSNNIENSDIIWSDTADTVTPPDAQNSATMLTINMGNVINHSAVSVTDTISIIYRTRILNNDAHAQADNTPIINNAHFDYETYTSPPRTTRNATPYPINIQQPNLSVAKTATQQYGDTEVVADEVITYTVTITNNGTAPAYDFVLRDTLPVGMRVDGITLVSINGNPSPSPAPIYSYDVNTGVAEWNFDTGTADTYTIAPSGGTLVIIYTAEPDSDVGSSLTLSNSAQVQTYYSFDDEAIPTGSLVGDREDYGPSNISNVNLTTPGPSQLLKVNNSGTTASIGIPFTYRITVPETPIATALYDVLIIDNLYSQPDAGLVFVDVQKISGSQNWTPENTGTPTALVIEDTTNGIDIPANEQIEIEVTVELLNASDNNQGDTFDNTASYTFNSIKGDNATQTNGDPDTADVSKTIVEPLTMELTKTAPAFIQFGVPGTYTIDVENTGLGPAFDLTITDHLPDPTVGGMCDTPPDNFAAEIRDNTNTVVQTLTYGTDFTSTFTPATTISTATGTETTCTLTITTLSANAEMQSGWHLVAYYDAHLDVGNENGDMLQNYAAATRWFSANTSAGEPEGNIREYTNIFDANDPGTSAIVDHQDVGTTQVQAPDLDIQKTVFNVATGDYAATAEPTETLRYEITITNNGPVAATDFSLSDEIDRLNPAPGFFVAGSLANVTVNEPDGVNTIVTNTTGGGKGTGLIQISDLDLTEAGGSGDRLYITFEATLIPVIDSGNIISNQAELTLAGFNTLLSDDPAETGDEDPTRTRVGSFPIFQTYKTSTDITGDPNVLERGDVLTYTMTVKNIGVENASVTLLHDQIPANTTYVPNTTTLNGVFVTDPSDGVSPLEQGMLVNAPENTTPGFMRAESDPADTANIATVTFNVMVNDNVVNGTIISNQAYVGGEGVGSGAFPEQLSDDPDTEILGDPTRDVVGNVAILDVQKTVEHIADLNSDGFIDPLETIRYTITVSNGGLVEATNVVLLDNMLAANVTYVADSLTLNGETVTGSSLAMLAGGIPISSSDLTPPLPTAGNGRLSPGETATVIFDVVIGATANDGDLISNQGTVLSNEFPDELTDADGNDINGDQPTVVTVGSVQQLSITKDVFVVGGCSAQPGGLLEYLITVRNNGNVPIDLRNLRPNTAVPPVPFYVDNTADADILKLIDRVDQNNAIAYVDGSARLNGVASAYIDYQSPRLLVRFDDSKKATSNLYQFDPGDSFTVRYLARIDADAVPGATIIRTTAGVDWGDADFLPATPATNIICVGGSQNVDACATSTLTVGGAPGVAGLSGKAWHDGNFDEVDQSGERVLEGWEVQIYFGDNIDFNNPTDYLDSVYTDANGDFSIAGLIPNIGDAKEYGLKFVAPGASTSTASLGDADGPFASGPQRFIDITLDNSSYTTSLNLPIQPDGVVYNAITREGVAGARLELLDTNGISVSSTCLVDETQQQDQVTLVDGYYKFEPLFVGGCQGIGDYTIRVYPPATGFLDDDNIASNGALSRIIPPILSATDPNGYNVQTCSDDVDLATTECEIQVSEFAPGTSVPPRTAGTDYYLKVNLNLPNRDQLYNNHIPLDPELTDAIAISKKSPLVNVTRSQLVPYIITLTNSIGAPVYDINVIDNYPAGFKYVEGSTQIFVDDFRTTTLTEEPLRAGLQLTWPDLVIQNNQTTKIKLLLVVGSGVGEGEYINRAHAFNTRTFTNASGEANATVRVVPDPTFDCSDVIGKIFDDKNLNGYQDENEPGIPDARVITAKGLKITADEFGRFHITCAMVPNEDRGSNFIVKLDERSLPTGYRLTTENPRVMRATRGRMLKFNFGATIHRVVRLDMADAVFEEDSTDIRPQWLSRIDLLIEQLQKAPSVLRLSYLADIEDESLVNDRVSDIKEKIAERWENLNCCYKLTIETEVFWRRGQPVRKEEEFKE